MDSNLQSYDISPKSIFLNKDSANNSQENDNQNGDDIELASSSIIETNKEKSAEEDYNVPPERNVAIVVNKQKENDIRKLTISNCRDLGAAFKFISSSIIAEELENLESVLQIQFKINKSLHEINPQEIIKLSGKFGKKALVVLFASTINEKMIIFWKSKNIQNFLTLVPYSAAFAKRDKKVYKFAADFLANSLKIGHLGIHKNYSNKLENRAEIYFLADVRNYNLLLLASESGEAEVVSTLLNLGMDTEIPFEKINAQALAWNGRHSNVILVFLCASLTFPTSIIIDECSQDLQMFYKICEEFHEAVIANDVEKVNEIISRKISTRHFFNLKNESVSKVAIVHRRNKIYEILLNNKISLAAHEDFEEITEKLEYDDKKALREIHFKYKKDLPEKHLNVLMTNSFVGHDVPNVQDKLDHIMNAFKFLNQISLIRIILLIVAASRRFKIIYDFNRESVNVADPTVDSNTQGLFYLSGRIYIGAKQLLSKATEKEAYATLAHELTHFAMYLVYDNDAKPYKLNDSQGSENFEKISLKCQENKSKENLISIVYECYPPDAFHAELIVRVPHLLALHHEEVEKETESRQNFPELYNHYEQKIIPEMKEALPEIELRDEKEMEKNNRKISELKRKYNFSIILSFTIAVIAACALTYIMISRINTKSYFDNLSTAEQSKVRNSIVSYKNIKLKFSDLFPTDSDAYKTLYPSHIETILTDQLLNITDLAYINSGVYTDWSNLPKVLKEIFLNSSFSLQNEVVKYSLVNNTIHEAFHNLSREQISDVLDGKLLQIGKNISTHADFYIERNFINNEQKSLLTIDEVIQETDNKRLMILSSEVGSGKTVTIEHLAMEMKNRFPDKWVINVNLTNFEHLYNKDFNTSSVKDIERLLEEILSLNSENEFEKQVFRGFFNSGKVIIFFDGFSQISQRSKSNIVNIMETIYMNTKNIQFMSTRNLDSHLITEKLNATTFDLAPLTKNDQNEYLRKFFLYKNLTNEQINELLQKSQNFINALKTKVVLDESNRDFNTPLLLNIVTNAYDENLLEFGNLFEIFESFIKKIKFSLEGEANEETYYEFALRTILSRTDSTIRLKLNQLSVIDKNTKHSKQNKQIQNQISSLGILLVSNMTDFRFVHQTFAEFYVAKYIIKNIFDAKDMSDGEAESRIEILFYLLKMHGYLQSGVTEFLKSFLKDLESKIGSIEFQSSISKALKSKFDNFLFHLLSTKHPEIFETVFSFFGFDCDIFEHLLHVNEDETFYSAVFNPTSQSHYINPSYILNLLEENAQNCSINITNLVNGRNQKGVFLYGIFFYRLFSPPGIHWTYEIPKKYGLIEIQREVPIFQALNLIKANLNEKEQQNLCKVAINPKLYVEFVSFNLTDYQNIWESCENHFSLNEQQVLLGFATAHLLEVESRAFSINFGEYLDFYINKSEAISDTENDGKIIFDTYRNNHIIHKATKNYTTFNVLWNFLEKNLTAAQKREILDFDDNGIYFQYYNQLINNQYYDVTPMKIFHRSLLSPYPNNTELFKIVRDLYQSSFEKSEIQKLITKSNDFLIYVIQYSDFMVCEQFGEHLEELFQNQTGLLTKFLKQKIKRAGLTIFDYFRDVGIKVSNNLSVFSNLCQKLNCNS